MAHVQRARSASSLVAVLSLPLVVVFLAGCPVHKLDQQVHDVGDQPQVPGAASNASPSSSSAPASSDGTPAPSASTKPGDTKP